jgi:hypothetical protein
MNNIVLFIPPWLAFAWFLWFCVQAKWNSVIAVYWHWVVIIMLGVMVILALLVNRKPKEDTALMIVAPKETEVKELPEASKELVAKEITIWKTTTRERSIYAKPK